MAGGTTDFGSSKAFKNNNWRSELKDIPQIAYSKRY
jgi:hypothetical protein